METNLMACNNDWLNVTQPISVTSSSCIIPFTYQNFYPYYYPVYYTSPARPIKLTLSEIEKLREIAKNDKSIKDILMKFTSQIEIMVDF